MLDASVPPPESAVAAETTRLCVSTCDVAEIRTSASSVHDAAGVADAAPASTVIVSASASSCGPFVTDATDVPVPVPEPCPVWSDPSVMTAERVHTPSRKRFVVDANVAVNVAPAGIAIVVMTS